MVSGVRVEGVAMVVGVLDLAGALQRLGRGGAATRDEISGCPPKKKKSQGALQRLGCCCAATRERIPGWIPKKKKSKDHCNG